MDHTPLHVVVTKFGAYLERGKNDLISAHLETTYRTHDAAGHVVNDNDGPEMIRVSRASRKSGVLTTMKAVSRAHGLRSLQAGI